MGKEVDVELYEFLKEHETGLYKDHHSMDKIVAFVHVDFPSLGEFVDIVGAFPFEDGGCEVIMFRDSICIELNDIIEGMGYSLLSFKKCFQESDWENYEEGIKLQEGE